MRTFFTLLPLLLFSSLAILAWQTSPAVQITEPGGGEALQGVVAISGSTQVEEFKSASLFFGYARDLTGTWFRIAENIPATEAGVLAEWNTFLITDGEYTLRLVVTLQDGSILEHRVENIRVRNYSPVETSTPAPTLTPSPAPTMDPTEAALLTPTVTPPGPTPTFTPLPPNPARLTGESIQGGLLVGAGGALMLFLLLGLYASLREALQRK